MAALKQQLQQKLQQKLSPQQIQLIRLLELTEIEFEERVQQELVDNPALEEGREEIPDSINEFDANADEDGNPGESAEELTLGDYRNEEDIPDYRLEADNYSKDDKKEDIPFVSASSFHDYLESQLGELSLDETSYQIAQYIIGNIDDNGYLQRPIQAISDDLIFQVGLDVPVSANVMFAKKNWNKPYEKSRYLIPSPEAHGTTAIRAARNITLFPTFLSKRKMGS